MATALTDQGEEEVIVDFYGPGDVLGEIGMVLNISDQSEIGYICETDTQVIVAIVIDNGIMTNRLSSLIMTISLL